MYKIDNYIMPKDEDLLFRNGNDRISREDLHKVITSCGKDILEINKEDLHYADKACGYIYNLSRVLRVLYIYMEDNANWEDPKRIGVSLNSSKNRLLITEDLKEFLRNGVTAEIDLDLANILISGPNYRIPIEAEIMKYYEHPIKDFVREDPSCFQMFMYFNMCYDILKAIKEAIIRLQEDGGLIK